MAALEDPEDKPDSIIDTPFDSALSERYLVYALSTITARSLPDLRDGLKPVHRRLLWAMRQLRLTPDSGFKKSARVVGDVIGKYHPHGDVAVYDAMVRLAQPFTLRYPLVEGQGNFGNVDGDNAAAYRYTECRLTPVAIALMAGLDEGTVEFIPTYNGEDEEPEIFPGAFPNLLANGAAGIAVGMATSIPSHNAAEVIDAALELIDNPDVTHTQLMALMPGPDFATGGLVVDPPEAISAAYESGRGGFRVRGRFFAAEAADEADRAAGIERQKGGGWQLVISEVPYQVQKSRLIEQIAAVIAERKVPILEDVRDESDEAIRIVLVPRSRNVEPELLKESLYKLTDLETRFSLNMNVLDVAPGGAGRAPMVMGLKEVLARWVAAQIDILQRRARHRLGRIADRLELVDGYIVAFLNLDRVIAIIRGEDEPKPVLMAEFTLTDRQAEAILNMRLRSLRKLEEMELRREKEALLAEREELETLLASPQRQRTRLKKDLRAIRKNYAEDTALGRRRTTIAEAQAEVEFRPEAMIEKEPVTVILSERGWIKAARGHAALDGEYKFKEGDGPAFALHAQTTDKLLLVADDGRVFTLAADKLPGGRGFGEPLRGLLDLDAGAIAIALLVLREDRRVLLAASSGRGFVAAMADLAAETRKGRQVVNLKGDVRLKVARVIGPQDDHVAVVGDNRKLVVFALEEVPQMGRGQGVMLQRYRDGGLADAVTFRLEEGLSWTMGGETGRLRTEMGIGEWKVARGAAGRLPPTGFPRDKRF